jgi:hypothetical protein
MAVTVRQCLELPSLAEAEVIAGAGGLDRPVRGISVLESAGVPEYITEDIMLGDEIVITGFISHRTDVDRQCQIIRILNEGGEAALILFYVGIFMPEVSQKLIDTANELDFPLIRMPLNRVDIPYSEVINEVMELLFRRKLRSNAWLGDPERESEAELVQVILDDDKLGMLRLERKMGADQMAIRDMRVLMRENDAIRLDAGRTMLEAVRAHYLGSGIRAYAALYDGALVVLIPSSTGRPRGNDADHLMQAVREPDIVLAVVDGMADLNELRGHHALIRRTLQPARQIFRTKNVFNRHDLGFVDNVLRIVAGGAETTRPYSSLVKKIREHGEDGAGRLYETLETLILDANMSTAATASLLYLHQHTVQYRLRKIKDLLGDDVFQVSTQFELATALAIQRLLEGKKQQK